jgi:hypothetical protein
MYSCFRILFFSPPLDDAQGEIRTAGYAEPAEVAFYGFDGARVSLVIDDKYLVRAQLHTDTAPFAPLVKNIERDFRIFALLFFLGIFNLGLLGQQTSLPLIIRLLKKRFSPGWSKTSRCKAYEILRNEAYCSVRRNDEE